MEEVIQFVQSCPTVRFAKNDILLYQNEKLEHLYAISSGYVKVHDIANDGSEQLLAVSGKYDFIPMEAVFSEQPDTIRYFYSAFSDVTAYVVDKYELLAQIGAKPDVLRQIVNTLSHQQTGLVKHLNAAQKPKAREKLAFALDLLAGSFSRSTNAQEDVVIDLPLTHQDIASLLGLTRETTSLELKRLKDEGYLDYSKNNFVVHRTKLAELL